MTQNTVSYQHQMSRHDFAVGLRNGACRAEALAADEAQGGRRVPSVGSAAFSFCGSTRSLLTVSLNWPGADATAARSFPFTFARGGSLTRLSDRRQVSGFLPPVTGPVATFIRRCRLARGPQFGFPHNRIRQDRDVPESHKLERLSRVSVAYVRNQTTKALAHGSILLPREQND